MQSSNPPAAAPEAAVSVRGAVKHFGAVRAVDGIDLDVGHGEVFGLIGHNGAGKSTLFRMMLGLARPTAGRIDVCGADVTGRHFRAARRSVGYLPENVVLYDNLTGLETLRYFARLKGVATSECAAVLDRVGLTPAGGRAVREYSKGMRQRLGFAQALLGRPRVLFLDEPTNGLDPEAIRAFYATLRELRADGVTTIVTSHILSELQERMDRVAILHSGRVQAAGTVQSLRERVALPLRIEVLASHAGEPAVRELAARLPLTDGQWHGNLLSARLPRDAKMTVVAALAGIGSAVRDLKIHEPSLEDVFFGLAD